MNDAEIARLKDLGIQAARHLRAGRADLARAPLDQLLRAVPQDEGVRMLARQAAAIGFPWPARRAEREPQPRPAPPDPAAVDLVAFHVDLPAAPSGIHGAIDYAAVLAQSFESARLRAPAARRLLLTDEATALPAGLAADGVLRFPLDRERLMYERMRVQALYLAGREAGRASVLMDSDVVVNREPAEVFGEDFDVALTWRPEFPDAPFNGGMILVAPGAAGLAFLEEARRCYDALAADPAVTAAYPRDLRAWWGDQFALAAVVGYPQFAARNQQAAEVNGIRVRFFPCETHNFTLEPARQYAAGALRAKHFIHFKGNRKALQARYLEAMRAGRV